MNRVLWVLGGLLVLVAALEPAWIQLGIRNILCAFAPLFEPALALTIIVIVLRMLWRGGGGGGGRRRR